MLELKDLKKMHDKAYLHSQVTRENAADDLVFYYVTQWDDNILAESQLSYRGEFNILRKAGRKILSDLASNPVQNDFETVDGAEKSAADILDGLYRTDDARNSSLEAYSNAARESVVCGFGAWELRTEYQSTKTGENKQVIRRYPIHETNNTVFFDPDANLLDKSDADWVSVLTAYSHDGYKSLVKDLTGEVMEGDVMDSFKEPEQSYVFPWLGGGKKKIFVTKFYHRKLIKDTLFTMSDPFGQTSQMRASTIKEAMDELISAGYSITSEKDIDVYQVTRYVASGSAILDASVIAGEHIPIIPVYGERAYVEGEEHYEGVTRLTKDPQRLRNFQMSYLADIVSRSPRQKPIYHPEQIAGFEDMYSLTGSENNYPYLLQNRKAGDGSDLAIGPIGVTPEQPIPSALVASIQLSRDAVSDVADAGMPQDVADPDLSGKAVLALQARIDMQSMIYQENLKHAKRRDGEVYASLAAAIYDVPRKVKLTLPDGTKRAETIMNTMIDEETGNIIVLNDISTVEFEVFSKIGPSYTSRKDQTVDRLEKIISTTPPGDPMREILMLKLLKLMDGVDFDDIRQYANKQLVIKGIKEPETDEEKQMMEELARQPKQPTAEMLLAMAEMKKGEADMADAQFKSVNIKLTAQNEELKRQIDMFKAQTDRLAVQVDAGEAEVNIDTKRIDAFGKKLDNTEKILELKDFRKMPTSELASYATGILNGGRV